MHKIGSLHPTWAFGPLVFAPERNINAMGSKQRKGIIECLLFFFFFCLKQKIPRTSNNTNFNGKS